MVDVAVFISKDFEPYRKQLNELYGYPPEGKNGYYANDGERKDGEGKTYNYMNNIIHPTEDKWYIDIIGIPQSILNDADYTFEKPQANLIADGWINNEP